MNDYLVSGAFAYNQPICISVVIKRYNNTFRYLYSSIDSAGMALFQGDRPTVHIPIVGSDQIADVTGAGDTVIATMTLALSAGATFDDAARLDNYAGGLVVMKRGTATVSASALRYAISGGAVGRAAGPA